MSMMAESFEAYHRALHEMESALSLTKNGEMLKSSWMALDEARERYEKALKEHIEKVVHQQYHEKGWEK